VLEMLENDRNPCMIALRRPDMFEEGSRCTLVLSGCRVDEYRTSLIVIAKAWHPLSVAYYPIIYAMTIRYQGHKVRD
jgi:hypothetical protein